MKGVIMEIFLANLTWPLVEEILKKPNAVVVPVGSVEQHGRHLPLSVDYRCPAYVAELAARKFTEENGIRVLVAPAIHYGETTGFGDFPGTIGLTIDTSISVYEDIARGFIRSGFKNIIFLNGHFSNAGPLNIALRKVYLENRDIGLYALNWSGLGFEVIPKIRKSEFGLHADEIETSATLVIQPENVRLEEAVKEMPTYSLSDRWTKPAVYGKVFFHSRKSYPVKAKGSAGVMGDPTVASRETGEKVLNACGEELANLIMEIIESEKKYSP